MCRAFFKTVFTESVYDFTVLGLSLVLRATKFCGEVCVTGWACAAIIFVLYDIKRGGGGANVLSFLKMICLLYLAPSFTWSDINLDRFLVW